VICAYSYGHPLVEDIPDTSWTVNLNFLRGFPVFPVPFCLLCISSYVRFVPDSIQIDLRGGLLGVSADRGVCGGVI
jgi:hypothetical protein